jgi:glutaconyl-CoA/methylmalonyl-CoA decarboxylase subunit gamma
MTAGGPAALRANLAPGSAPAAEDATNGAGGPGGSLARMVVRPLADGRAVVDGQEETASLAVLGGPRARLTTPDGTHDVVLLPVPDVARSAAGVQRLEVVVDGWRFEVDLEPEARAALRDRATRAAGDATKGGPLELRAIIPGRVLSVDVADGDTVETGQRVLVVEAMKMQNELRAPRGGTVRGIAVGPGQTVEQGDVLLVVE